MTIHVPAPLLSYTRSVADHEVEGATLAQALAELDGRFPGIRFRIIDEQGRIRTHIRFFVNGVLTPTIEHPLSPADEVTIVCALSGGRRRPRA